MRGVAMDPTTRARARLFLRSEAAMGQNALPLRKTIPPSGHNSEKTPPATQKGGKEAGRASNPAPKANPKSSVALELAPGAMRQAGGGDSVDIFMMEGV